ncbi:1-phosphofructokinase family hexose kinase [Olsenella sp. YH-ols2217]|uniref:1-phosphofructokinase family hexose kinase n=1 Tax=Kribbibacterium absianum TaxID=3044210 RepID=A0ABT6ZIP4_9ACTN|nr:MULTISPECIES: 1-phosphofructokinase family hexose kinase [unclassified Olsenella]MDJ1121025.1 1-phosphofructokinase family hexose kinase [Olsenella sp. YH-ols2216]MDJ1128516.1 1-phosphofructokinase family hexose kinase [Olsenella sp. YH-ols2217]
MIYTVTFNPSVDYVMHPTTLDMGYTNRSTAEEFYAGGNGINVSTILTELDVDNVAMGLIGGFTGEFVLDTLQAQGINTNFVRLDKGNTRINVKLNGIIMTIINGMGPNIPIAKVDELFRRIDRIQAGSTLVLTGSIPSCLPDDMYDIMMSRFGDRGIRFVVDAPGDLLMNALAAKPFFIKPNNHEVGRIFGANPETPEEVLPYARLLHEKGAQNVLVSCGGYGAALVDEYGQEHTTKCPPCRLVNATGAGDSMVAGFLAALDRGWDYGDALNYASACGSATAASNGLANRETIERFYNSLVHLLEDEASKAGQDPVEPVAHDAGDVENASDSED